jgi:type VI secretion system protein ImpC
MSVKTAVAEVETVEAETSSGLKYIYETMNIAPPETAIAISDYRNPQALAESKTNERIGAALAFFVDSVIESAVTVDRIDKVVLDNQIAELDRRISLQLDEILHAPRGEALISSSSAPISGRMSKSIS